MKLPYPLIVLITLITLPACQQNTVGNQPNGVKDAIGARPYEGVRDAAEDAGDAANKAGQEIKNVISGS